MESSKSEHIVGPAHDEPPAQAALRCAHELSERRAALRVKLAGLLALGTRPREDLPGMILSLKDEESRLLEAARAASPSATPGPAPRARRVLLARLLHGLRRRSRLIDPLVAQVAPDDRATVLEAIALLAQEGVLRHDDTGRRPRLALLPQWVEPAREFALLGKPLGLPAVDTWVRAEAHPLAA